MDKIKNLVTKSSSHPSDILYFYQNINNFLTCNAYLQREISKCKQ